jgi:hypothetical protein
MVALLRHSRRKRGVNGYASPTATALGFDSTESSSRRSVQLNLVTYLPILDRWLIVITLLLLEQTWILQPTTDL